MLGTCGLPSWFGWAVGLWSLSLDPIFVHGLSCGGLKRFRVRDPYQRPMDGRLDSLMPQVQRTGTLWNGLRVWLGPRQVFGLNDGAAMCFNFGPDSATGLLEAPYGSGSKPKVCNRAGAHTRDIPGYIEYVTGRRLSRQPPPLALLFLVIFHKPRQRVCDKPRVA